MSDFEMYITRIELDAMAKVILETVLKSIEHKTDMMNEMEAEAIKNEENL